MRISIEGSIGSGKSTTARMVAERLSYPVVLEKTDIHPFLSDFYADPAGTAVETELAFVLLHYHQLFGLNTETDLVTDFSPAKDLVFGRMNLSGEDLDIFEHLYAKLTARIPRSEIAIFLDLPIDLLLDRIRQRGRPYELGIPRTYLERLDNFYRQNIETLGRLVRIVPVSELDSRDAVADHVVQAIRASAERYAAPPN